MAYEAQKISVNMSQICWRVGEKALQPICRGGTDQARQERDRDVTLLPGRALQEVKRNQPKTSFEK
jgi:hypothetical protein